MLLRRSLRLPITLAIVMIALLVVLIVGWVLLAVFGATSDRQFAGFYWALLSIGTTFLVLVLVGVVIYLLLSIKAINLNRRQSNFIDSVTHELKSPIASLKLYLQTLRLRAVSSEERADFYQFMLDDVERLDQLINHLLDAARLDKQPVQGDEEEVELAGLLRECAEQVTARYHVPPETIRLELDPAVVSAQRVDLDMIFRNLVDNAVKYAGTPPQVEITLHFIPKDRVVIRIADNGRGIPPKMRRKIFGRFERLGLELKREKPGTGLGLFIVRTLVRRLRGRVRVNDRAGPGTVFEVQLPGKAAPAGRGSSPAGDQAGARPVPEAPLPAS